MTDPPGETLDVAIIGGGVAGAYCAWRLLCDRGDARERPPKVALFEGSARTGGRLLSLKPPGMDRVVCDLGGMYFANVHPLVTSLVRRLHLATAPVPSAARSLYYLRGAHLPPTVAKPPYDLAPEERDSHPDTLLRRAIERLLPGVTALRGAELDDALGAALVAGSPLADWSISTLLARSLSGEALALIRDSRPDDFMLGNGNAEDALRVLLSFGKGTRLSHLPSGYQSIPDTLCDEVHRAGGAIDLVHRLNRFHRGADGVFELHLSRDSRGWGHRAGGEPVVVRARAIVLAMPRRSLELLEQTGPLFDDARASSLLASAAMLPAFKAFMAYPSPWWRELEKAAFAVTDLPMRMNHDWGTESDQPGAPPGNPRSLLLTTLAHSAGAGFWASLQGEDRLATPYVGASTWDAYALPTTGRLAAEAQRQIGQVHGLVPPDPYAVACMDWGMDPFGGAAGIWNVHVRSRDAATKILQPVPGLPVFICGEAYSRNQGWVEGSLETTEAMLEAYFGLPRPAWLDASGRSAAP